ncbi:MAG: hypothetical protein E7292_00555 [Lachnospiraceae bacterium]|nr:hypothetical protein [Lachnospiraceae bacterium]
MNKFLEWWKEDKRYILLIKALLMALLPVMCCVVTTAVEGASIGSVYLPSSEWNDELFYYKQVESIVEFGYPQGYYGFNESHGLKLSFAAWSPVLVLPWIVWGLLFGWNMLSPVICNILLMTVAMFLFVWLVKPNWKQLGVLTLLFCLYTPFVRYMLSGMPEIICISHLIVFYGLAINYQKAPHGSKIAGLFGISGLLTLMRPYMLLFLLLPAFYWVRDSRKKGRMWLGISGSGLVIGVVLGCYAMIKHYFGAEYFHPLFFTDWITTFFDEGFGRGVENFFGTLYWKGKDFYAHTVQGLRTGLASGAFFAGYMVTCAILLWQSVADYGKLRKGKLSADKTEDVRAQLIAEAHLAISFIGMFFALLLMYKLTEGSKHLLTFMAVGVFVVSMMDTKFYKKAVLLGATFAFLYTYRAVDPYDYQVPYVTEERQIQVEDWQVRFADALELTKENVPNYDNAVMWVFNEQSAEGETMKWQLFYALPEGFGISCCQKDFVLANFDILQCRYFAVQSGAEVDARCKEAGYIELSRDKDMVLYGRY